MLSIAFSLAVLTYYIGVLIYSIPIPWYGLKRWAPMLIVDGIIASGLVLFFNNIILLVDYVYNLLGASWDSYLSHMKSLWAMLFSLILFIEMFLTVLTKMPLRIYLFSSILYTFRSILSYGLLIITLLIILSIVVKTLLPKLVALSILLYSIPFRIARTAGASLLAFAIVFYIGLPLMPYFILTLALPESVPETFNTLIDYGVAYPRILIKSLHDDPIPFAILNVYSDNGELIARYVSERDGWVYASYPNKGLPAIKEYYVDIVYYGLVFKTIPNRINPLTHYIEADEIRGTNYECIVTVPGIVKFHKGILVLNNADIIYKLLSISEQGDLTDISLIIDVKNNGYYNLIALPDDYQLLKITLNQSSIKYNVMKLNWFGKTIDIISISLNSSTYSIDIQLAGKYTEVNIPKSIEKPYVLSATGGKSLNEILESVSTTYAVLSIIFPTMYIIMLTMIAYGFASFLGARYPRIPFRVS